ncbi:MAG TPA: hypothetical protein VJS92_03815 [Candidatus Polarisedimenticolaceae bacterium]|nr:hypothetical protein [Candidatus Polarisedimenticolaceae bacterium]
MHFLIAAVLGTALAAPAGPSRVILNDGRQFDVPGPILREEGRLVFRTAKGTFFSIDAAQVREVKALAEPARADEAREGASVVRYTNADLPAAPPRSRVVVPEEPASPAAAPPTDLRELDADSPREFDGHDAEWWRTRASELRESIAELQRTENTSYRLLICAQHDLPLKQGECYPRVNMLPIANWIPRTPTERSLATRLAEARQELEQRRAELTELLDRAFELGVPTGWVLPED